MIRKEKGDRQDFREIRAVGFTGDTVGRVKRQAAARGDFCSSVHGRVSERAAASPGDLRCSTGAAVNRAVPHLGTLLRADLKRKNPARTGGDSGDETCCGDRRRLDLTWPCTAIAPQQKRSQNSLRTNPSLRNGPRVCTHLSPKKTRRGQTSARGAALHPRSSGQCQVSRDEMHLSQSRSLPHTTKSEGTKRWPRGAQTLPGRN